MLETLANLGEAIGGIAVLITLVYMAIQIRQTRQELARQNARDMVRKNNDLLMMLTQNPQLMSTYMRASTEFESCTREEQLAYTLWLFSWVAQTEQALRDQQGGTFDGVELEGYTEGTALTLRTPGARKVWERIKFNFDPGFQAFLDKQIAKSDETAIDRFTGY